MPAVSRVRLLGCPHHCRHCPGRTCSYVRGSGRARGQGFQGEFLWAGTADETAWLAVPAALAVIGALGRGTQAAHARQLLAAAVPLLQAALGTRVVLGAGAAWAPAGRAVGRQGRRRRVSRPVCSSVACGCWDEHLYCMAPVRHSCSHGPFACFGRDRMLRLSRPGVSGQVLPDLTLAHAAPNRGATCARERHDEAPGPAHAARL